MKTFYAATNNHANTYSVGFANTWFVMAFGSRKARDAFVAAATDRATRAITKREITRYASNWSETRNEYNRPRPFTNQYWGIVDDTPEYTALGRPDGYLGHVTVCDPDGPENGHRVFG